MRIALTAFLSLFGIAANAADLAPCSCGAEEVHAFDVVGGAEAAVGYGFAGLSAETGVGIAAGVAVGLHGTDVAIAGYNAMANGVPQDTLTSQGLQAVGVPQDWANGIDAGISVIGTMGVGAATGGAGTVIGATGRQTEIVQRAMSRAELQGIKNRGILSRGGRSGDHYVSDAVNSTANRARQRLALPVQPEVRVTLEVPKGVFSAPTKVQPYTLPNGQVLPGGGMERIAPGNIDVPVRVISIFDY